MMKTIIIMHKGIKVKRALPFCLLTFLLFLLAGCSEEQDAVLTNGLSPAQMELIGRSINFSASHADPFTTRTTYRHDGSFNQDDIMTIYRQYSHDAGISFDVSSEAYRVYSLQTKYATGTSVELETDWKPKEGAIGHNPPENEEDDGNFTQTKADSLTWENGNTVRFRAWSRSNLAGALETSDKNRYYPDFCISEWVTVSGPTMDVPLTLKHQGCRILFSNRSGNELYKAEICVDDVEDYRRRDNSTDRDNDESAEEHGKSLEQAAAELELVKAEYNRMCMPSGVNINTSLLTTMTSELYEGMNDLRDISTKTETDGIVTFASKTPEYIAQYVQRPLFTSNLSDRLYMVTIPYDMSNGEHHGEVLRLPACTRFKVWLYDVNRGDVPVNSEQKESTYHIFALSDFKDENGDLIWPDGIELTPGTSYWFEVGYQYDQFNITPADHFKWDRQDQEEGVSTDRKETPDTQEEPYKWWKEAIEAAIPYDDYTKSYNPQFKISTREEFLEFIKLVNGTAVTDAAKNGGLTQKYVTVGKDENGKDIKEYRWYRTEKVNNGTWTIGDYVTREEAEAEGYIFYEHYYPANADQGAYSRENYLRGAYSFFDERLNRHFPVLLDADIDLSDWKLTTIGATQDTPFRGIFDGQMHTLKNVYMDGGYMFKNCFDVAIRNLKIETVHDFKLIHTAEAKESKTGYGAYVIGVSIKAPSAGNPIATTLTGSSYVVGCFYEGTATGAMVGTADNLTMYGNMMAASGLTSGTGALLGAYASGSSQFFAPQTAKKLTWGRFMVNYYDNGLSPGTHAVAGNTDRYKPQEYIRGAQTWILKAKNDNLLADDVPFELLTTDQMREGYYGLAPWKAMNYAIWKYNGSDVGRNHPCNGHYENNTTGYANTYPKLVSVKPDDSYETWNVLEQNN